MSLTIAIVLIIWFGIAGYLFYIDGKLKSLEKKINKQDKIR
jgi:CcmD family protein